MDAGFSLFLSPSKPAGKTKGETRTKKHLFYLSLSFHNAPSSSPLPASSSRILILTSILEQIPSVAVQFPGSGMTRRGRETTSSGGGAGHIRS